MSPQIFRAPAGRTLGLLSLRGTGSVIALFAVTLFLSIGCSRTSKTKDSPDSVGSGEFGIRTHQRPRDASLHRVKAQPSNNKFNLSAEPNATELIKAWNDLEKSGLKGLALSAAQEEFIQQASSLVDISLICETMVSVKGSGSSRTRLVAVAFAYSKSSSSSLLLAMASLPSNSERAAAGNSLAMHSSIDLADFKLLGKMPAECEDLFVNKLSLTISSSGAKDKTADACMGSLLLAISEGRASTSSLTQFLTTMSTDSPFEAWRLVTASDVTGLPTSERNTVLGTIARNMITENPAEAMRRLRSSEGGHGFAGAAVAAWFDKDSNEVKTWYLENRSSMSSEMSDASSGSIAAKMANQGDISAARQWTEYIQDPAAKGKIEGQVWTAERNQLKNEVAANPDKAINAIVSGESRYSDYWLEEAMAAWVTKDFNQAVAWHEKNWNTMPTEKAQYVAAAFANHALQEQDVKTAREWAALIQDSKTKARIDETIAKAVAERQTSEQP